MMKLAAVAVWSAALVLSVAACSAAGQQPAPTEAPEPPPQPISVDEMRDGYTHITGKTGSIPFLKEQAEFYCDPENHFGGIDQAAQVAVRVWGQHAQDVLDLLWSYGCTETAAAIEKLDQQ